MELIILTINLSTILQLHFKNKHFYKIWTEICITAPKHWFLVSYLQLLQMPKTYYDNPNSIIYIQQKKEEKKILFWNLNSRIKWKCLEKKKKNINVTTKISPLNPFNAFWKFVTENILSCFNISYIFSWFFVVVHLPSHVLLFTTQGVQHSRLLIPSLPPGVCTNSCPLSGWCYPINSSSAACFSFCLPSFWTSGSFPKSQPFPSGGLSIRASASASASVLPMSI